MCKIAYAINKQSSAVTILLNLFAKINQSLLKIYSTSQLISQGGANIDLGESARNHSPDLNRNRLYDLIHPMSVASLRV